MRQLPKRKGIIVCCRRSTFKRWKEESCSSTSIFLRQDSSTSLHWKAEERLSPCFSPHLQQLVSHSHKNHSPFVSRIRPQGPGYFLHFHFQRSVFSYFLDRGSTKGNTIKEMKVDPQIFENKFRNIFSITSKKL